MTQPPALFDTALAMRHAARARLADIAPVLDEIYRRSVDRLLDMKQRYATLHHLGMSEASLQAALGEHAYDARIEPIAMTGDETLMLQENSVDAALCVMGLHHVNDLPGMLIQLRRALKPDGLLLAVMPGVATLEELRVVMSEVETARYRGISPRVSPFLEVRDAGGLLQRAGFALPVVDSERITLTYPEMFSLMRDLRAAGQTSCLNGRRPQFTPLGFFAEAADVYTSRYSDSDGRIAATLELLTLTAWAPHTNQQQPLSPGSGKISLVSALK